MDFYSSEKITDKITAIRSKSGEIMYLVEGEEKAVLIDTCVGYGDLKSYVDSIRENNTPLTVLLSHGHIDHAMGAPLFENCYMNCKDVSLYESQCDIDGRKGYVAMNTGMSIESLNDVDFVSAQPDYKFNNLTDGMKFDLGGVTVVAYNANGHTEGCMAFLIPEEKVLITGDACNNATFLFFDFCCSVSEYKKNIIELKNKTEGKYNIVLLMHHITDAPIDLFDQMIELCDEIIAGNDDKIPFDFMGKAARLAKSANERMERSDGKFPNLVYDPNKIL